MLKQMSFQVFKHCLWISIIFESSFNVIVVMYYVYKQTKLFPFYLFVNFFKLEINLKLPCMRHESNKFKVGGGGWILEFCVLPPSIPGGG